MHAAFTALNATDLWQVVKTLLLKSVINKVLLLLLQIKNHQASVQLVQPALHCTHRMIIPFVYRHRLSCQKQQTMQNHLQSLEQVSLPIHFSLLAQLLSPIRLWMMQDSTRTAPSVSLLLVSNLLWMVVHLKHGGPLCRYNILSSFVCDLPWKKISQTLWSSVGSILQYAVVVCVWTTWKRYLKRGGPV